MSFLCIIRGICKCHFCHCVEVRAQIGNLVLSLFVNHLFDSLLLDLGFLRPVHFLLAQFHELPLHPLVQIVLLDPLLLTFSVFPDFLLDILPIISSFKLFLLEYFVPSLSDKLFMLVCCHLFGILNVLDFIHVPSYFQLNFMKELDG